MLGTSQGLVKSSQWAVAVHNFSPSTQEAEIGESLVRTSLVYIVNSRMDSDSQIQDSFSFLFYFPYQVSRSIGVLEYTALGESLGGKKPLLLQTQPACLDQATHPPEKQGQAPTCCPPWHLPAHLMLLGPDHQKEKTGSSRKGKTVTSLLVTRKVGQHSP